MAKSQILCLRDQHHIFPVTVPSNVRRTRDSSQSRKSLISSKEVLNFQLPARLGLSANRRLTQTSLWSVNATQWNVRQLTKSVSALLTLCPDRILHREGLNCLATSTSLSQGDPDETCRPKSIKLLSHLHDPLARLPTLSIMGSRIAFQSPIKTIRFGLWRNGANRRVKKTLSAAILGA